jgi:hypothetical protein
MQHKHESKTPKSGTEAATVACAAKGCSFTVSLRARDGRCAQITSANLTHTCGGNEHRKRELSSTLLREMVPGLAALRGQGKPGDGKQVSPERCSSRSSHSTQTAGYFKRSTGKDIKRSQGVTLARSDLPKPLDHFLHFQRLTALVAYLKGRDPGGFYECQFVDDSGIKRFASLTIICSWWIQSGPHLRDVLNIDGTGLETFIGGTLIAALTLSANDNITPLGLLFTSSESVENVLPFMEHLRRLYPRQQFLVSDSGRAFETSADRAGFICHGGCSWHVRDKNARLKVGNCSGASVPIPS